MDERNKVSEKPPFGEVFSVFTTERPRPFPTTLFVGVGLAPPEGEMLYIKITTLPIFVSQKPPSLAQGRL